MAQSGNKITMVGSSSPSSSSQSHSVSLSPVQHVSIVEKTLGVHAGIAASVSTQHPPLHAKTTAVKAGEVTVKSGSAKPVKTLFGVRSGKVTKKGKQQQLQKVLSQQKKRGPSAQESLSQFLNSLK